MDEDIVSEIKIENETSDTKYNHGKETDNHDTKPGPVLDGVKKKRKYVSRKSKQNTLENHSYIKSKKKSEKLWSCQQDKNNEHLLEENTKKQTKPMNPFLVSCFLSMVQRRRNNFLMGLIPVSLSYLVLPMRVNVKY